MSEGIHESPREESELLAAPARLKIQKALEEPGYYLVRNERDEESTIHIATPLRVYEPGAILLFEFVSPLRIRKINGKESLIRSGRVDVASKNPSEYEKDAESYASLTAPLGVPNETLTAFLTTRQAYETYAMSRNRDSEEDAKLDERRTRFYAARKALLDAVAGATGTEALMRRLKDDETDIDEYDAVEEPLGDTP